MSDTYFKLDTGSGGTASRYNDIGSIEDLGDRFTVVVALRHALIGTLAHDDYFELKIERSDWAFVACFASDGLYIYDGADNNEVGTDLVEQQATKQTWEFKVDVSGGVASAVCHVKLNGVLKAASVDCSNTGSFTDGKCTFTQYGVTTDNQITYVGGLKIGATDLQNKTLKLLWDEADIADRALQFKVNASNRTVDIEDDVTLPEATWDSDYNLLMVKA